MAGDLNKGTNAAGKKGLLRRAFAVPEVGVMIPLIIIVVIVSLVQRDFYKINNITSILKGVSFYAMVSIGITMVILLGHIDISVGQVAGFSTTFSMMLMMNYHVGVPYAILIDLAVCACFGLFIGFCVTRLNLSAFIASIGMYYVARGMKFYLTKGYPIYPIPKELGDFGTSSPIGVSWAFLIALILILVFDFVLRKTVYGRKIYAVGDNKEVAKLAGINVRRVTMSAFVVCSVMAGVAGILLACQYRVGQPSTGDGWELQAIAAAAVGGISMAGGAGTMLGTFIGVLIIGCITNGLIVMGVDTNVQTMLIGFFMLGAVALDMFKRSRKMRA
jgi:ribose transport system permease protein